MIKNFNSFENKSFKAKCFDGKHRIEYVRAVLLIMSILVTFLYDKILWPKITVEEFVLALVPRGQSPYIGEGIRMPAAAS